MDDTEKMIATTLYQAIQDSSNFSDRSLQSKNFRVGVSDLGFCSERTRRMLDQQVPEETDMLKAWIGTALGDHAERAAMKAWPNAIRQAEVSIQLSGDRGSYTLMGHPDLILPEGILIDVKTDYGLSVIRRTGPSLQQQFQRHCYAKAAWLAGLFDDGVMLEDVLVANVWVDRAGIEQELHCQAEPFNEEYVDHAGQWLDEVVYSYLEGQEAAKEPPRDMCAVVCGFFPVCRAYDTDAEGLLSDPVTLTSVGMYQEGLALEKQGKALKDQAKQHLVGVQGSTGTHTVRWVHINDTVVPETVRRGYDKVDIRKVPKPKVVKGK